MSHLKMSTSFAKQSLTTFFLIIFDMDLSNLSRRQYDVGRHRSVYRVGERLP